MKSISIPAPFGLPKSAKVFSKIYNAFYCSKKTVHTPGVPESSTAETDLDSVAVDGEQQAKQAWFKAVHSGDLDKVKQLLDSKTVEVNTTDEFGWTGLHMAAWNGNVVICQELLSNQANVNLTGPGGSTPLTLSSQQGNTEIVRLFLEAECDVHARVILGPNMDVTALHLAAQNGHLEIAKLLVAVDPRTVNAGMVVRGIKGVTPLHLAVENNHMEIMDVLIEAGCDIQSSTQPSSETAC